LKYDFIHMFMHHLPLYFETTAHIPEVEFGGKYGYMRANMDIWGQIRITKTDFQPLLDMQKRTYCNKICDNKRLLHDIFHIGPGISPRLPYQARQWSWRVDKGRGLIPGTIWKISCHNLFITYFTLTFSKHWLLNCKKDLWTDKLR
jgi:hypothetical protein